MHICFITSEFPKTGFPHGGVGTFVATLGKALVEKGIQVSVIGLNYIDKEDTEIVDGIHVYRVTSKKIKGLQWYFNTQAVARKITAVNKNTSEGNFAVWFSIFFVNSPSLWSEFSIMLCFRYLVYLWLQR